MRWALLVKSLMHPFLTCALASLIHDAPQRLEAAALKQNWPYSSTLLVAAVELWAGCLTFAGCRPNFSNDSF
jgi:hypothetical protein